MNIGTIRSVVGIAAVFLLAVSPATQSAERTLSSETGAAIDQAAHEVLQNTGVPSASVAVVRDGQIGYVRGYGDARLDPRTPARPQMRYSIGSISKQFTAAAILLLAEEKKLSLDDPVGRFLPTLTRADAVTIRQVLSHTSGYRDYWPQDYVPPFMLQPITSTGILDRWARIPLDFEPGTQYQYSNTGYVIAGSIVEKAGGIPLLDFLRARIFAPLGMTSVLDVDTSRLTESDAAGYLRYGLGPARPAPKEGKGWLFAAGELAMTAADLAKWNVAVMERRILSRASWNEMETEIQLKNGVGTQYGLGVGVTSRDGHRALTHGGEVSGFTATNTVFPDDRAAVTVLTNEDSASAAEEIARRIGPLLFSSAGAAARSESRARAILEALQTGRIDRSLFTDNANAYFSREALHDFAAGLAPLGKIQKIERTAQRERGGMTFRSFEVQFTSKTVVILERDMPGGKVEQFQITAKD